MIGTIECRLQYRKQTGRVGCKVYCNFPSMVCGIQYGSFCPLVEKEIKHIKTVGHRVSPSKEAVRKRLTKRLSTVLVGGPK